MVRTKGTTTPKAFQLQFKLKQPDQATFNDNCDGESSSFRLLYYGDASAGSVPFMWESRPGTPKHSTTQSSLPDDPLTPPPALKHPTSLRTLFLDASFRKPHVPPSSKTSSSSISSQQSRTSLRTLFLASSSRKAHMAGVKFGREEKRVGGDGSPTATLCFGGGLLMVCRIKKVKNALMSIAGHGKTKSDGVI